MSFEAWMAKINRIVMNEAGVSIHDLPDMCFRDMFDDGCTPKEVAAEALAELWN